MGKDLIDMYKKAIGGLMMMNLLFLFSFLCIKGVEGNKAASRPVCETQVDEVYTADEEKNAMGIAAIAASGQRIVDYQVLDREIKITLEEQDMEALLRIVEAEAGTEDEDGRLLVANVVLNRVADENFPDSVSEVVFQKSNGVAQFSPVSNGRIWSVEISDETVEAVGRALEGEDISQGALYFAARKYADSKKMKWFDEHLTFLFSHGGLEFYGNTDLISVSIEPPADAQGFAMELCCFAVQILRRKCFNQCFPIFRLTK